MLIAAAQKFRLLGAAVVPYGTDGTNDLASWETIRAGNTGFSREATAEQPSRSNSGPAARWMAPSTPPVPSNVVLAALTIA